MNRFWESLWCMYTYINVNNFLICIHMFIVPTKFTAIRLVLEIKLKKILNFILKDNNK